MNANAVSRPASLAMAALLALPSSCVDSPTTPVDGIRNTGWAIAAFGTAEWQRRDLLGPVQLHYGDTEYFGTDGCRSFAGRYVARGDSVFPRDLEPLSPLLCTLVTSPIEPLLEPYRIEVDGSELRIFAGEIVYAFRRVSAAERR